MVGVVRSAACQHCKRRRIKCDQCWPACTQCKRKGLKCPGPSSLIKFVNEGQNVGHQVSSANQTQVLSTTKARPILTQLLEARPTDSRGRYISTPDGHSGYRKIKPAPLSPNIISLDERVGLRLISSLESDLNILRLFSFLKHMPARFADNPCLRDVANLFCTTHAALRRGSTPTTDVAIMKDYGKALRTLRRTLEGSRGLKVETLASVALLSRAESAFDPAWTPFRDEHTEAVVSFVGKLGQPKPDDEFHMAILFEALQELLSQALYKGVSPIYGQLPWRETIRRAMLGYFPPKLKPYGGDLINISDELYNQVPKALAKVYQVHREPFSPGMQDLAVKLLVGFARDSARASSALDLVLDMAFEVGELTETLDPEFFLGSYYRSKNGRFGECMTLVLALLVGIARIRYDLSALYDYPTASALYAEYRKLCIKLWMFIPIRMELYRAFAFRSLVVLAPSYEGSEGHEREYLTSVLQEQDANLRRLPKERDKFEAAILAWAKTMTGRLPLVLGHG